MYKVTLSMPIYNVAPYVEQALLSALNQTFDSIEFLLVDDRGTDNSMEIVHRVIKDHLRGKDVRIIKHPHNIGTGATKNTAIDNAQGEYLFFMDSDDIITSNCIELMYNLITKNNSEIVIGSVITQKPDGTELNKYIYPNKDFNTSYEYMRYRIKCGNKILPCTWNKLYKLDLLKSNKIKCISYHTIEDQIFDCQVSFYFQKVSLIPDITYKYIIRENSVMGNIEKFNITDNRCKEYIDILNYKLNFYTKYRHTDIHEHLLVYLVIESIYYSRSLFKSKNKNKDKVINRILNYNNYHINIFKILSFHNYWKYILLYLLPMYFRKIILKLYYQ